MIFKFIGFLFILIAVVISAMVVFGGMELTGFGIILLILLSLGGLLLLLTNNNTVRYSK